jgi:conjugative transfer signal peptidase TraF
MKLTSFFSLHKKLGILMIVGTPLLVSFLMSACLGYRVLINTSTSLPHTFYITNPKQVPVKRGDYIAFNHPASPKIIVKRVIGIEGDDILKTAHSVYIKGCERKLFLKEKRSDGSVLTAVNADVVPEKTFFVAGSHHGSFDSRYQEFGLIPLAQVREQVWPLF